MASAEPASEAQQNYAQHRHTRFFIGPMPAKVVSSMQAGKTKLGRLQAFYSTSTVNEDPDLSRLVIPHAFNFFLRGGGSAQHWGEAEERSTVDAMTKRFQESEWGKVVFGEKQDIRPHSWVGGSFEIGGLLGMNIIHNEASEIRDGVSDRSGRKSKSPTEPNEVLSSSSAALEISVAAPSPPREIREADSGVPLAPENDDIESQGLVSATSSTALLKLPSRHATSTTALKPILRSQSSPAAPLNGPLEEEEEDVPRSQPKLKSAPKLVHYVEVPNGEVVDPGPAPPNVVLERTGSAVADTSAGATVPHPSEDLQWGDVVMRGRVCTLFFYMKPNSNHNRFAPDRMLVRVMHTSLESVGTSFDETQNRTMDKLHYNEWQEYLVVWRKDQIELYQNYVRICGLLSFIPWISTVLYQQVPPLAKLVCEDQGPRVLHSPQIVQDAPLHVFVC